MRPPLLNAYATVLPRLEARAQLAEVTIGSAAAGAMDEADAKQLLRDLREAALIKVKARKATPGDLAAVGITIVEV